MGRVVHIIILMLSVGLANAQDFPSKPIRIVTGPAAGGSDFASRLIAQGITGPLGQPVVVDNRTSAGAPTVVLSDKPDGYTLMVLGNSLWVRPLVAKLPYDAVRDFSPITWITRDINLVIVHPSLPVKSIKELIALAKARPGELNYGSTGVGGGNHLGVALFTTMAGINVVGIQYTGEAAAIRAVVSGEVQMAIFDLGSVAPLMKSGQLRALAVTSATPTALAPGMPTVAAAGLPGYESVGVTAMWAPAKTPAAIIQRLNQEIVRFLNTAEVKQRFLSLGSEVVANSPEQFDAAIKADIARMTKVIKDANIKVE